VPRQIASGAPAAAATAGAKQLKNTSRAATPSQKQKRTSPPQTAPNANPDGGPTGEEREPSGTDDDQRLERTAGANTGRFSAWHALAACRLQSGSGRLSIWHADVNLQVGKKLEVVRAAARYDYPSGDIDGMLTEIESGYGRGKSAPREGPNERRD